MQYLRNCDYNLCITTNTVTRVLRDRMHGMDSFTKRTLLNIVVMLWLQHARCTLVPFCGCVVLFVVVVFSLFAVFFCFCGCVFFFLQLCFQFVVVFFLFCFCFLQSYFPFCDCVLLLCFTFFFCTQSCFWPIFVIVFCKNEF